MPDIPINIQALAGALILALVASPGAADVTSRVADFSQFEAPAADALDTLSAAATEALAQMQLANEEARQHQEYAALNPDSPEAIARAVESTVIALEVSASVLAELGAERAAIREQLAAARSAFSSELARHAQEQGADAARLEVLAGQRRDLEGIVLRLAQQHPRGSEIPRDVQRDVHSYRHALTLLDHEEAALAQKAAGGTALAGRYREFNQYFDRTEDIVDDIFSSIEVQRLEVTYLARIALTKIREFEIVRSLARFGNSIRRLEKVQAGMNDFLSGTRAFFADLVGISEGALPASLGGGAEEIHDFLDRYRQQPDQPRLLVQEEADVEQPGS